LKRVFRILLMVQHAAADVKKQGAVPLHQRGEGRLVAAVREAVEELAVAQVTPLRCADQTPQLPNETAELSASYDSVLAGASPSPYYRRAIAI